MPHETNNLRTTSSTQEVSAAVSSCITQMAQERPDLSREEVVAI